MNLDGSETSLVGSLRIIVLGQQPPLEALDLQLEAADTVLLVIAPVYQRAEAEFQVFARVSAEIPPQKLSPRAKCFFDSAGKRSSSSGCCACCHDRGLLVDVGARIAGIHCCHRHHHMLHGDEGNSFVCVPSSWQCGLDLLL